jgi:hypothetical protein
VTLNIFLIIAGNGADNWIALFLKRKVLEEKKKIEELEKKTT